MLLSFFVYLFESSICLLVFAIFYKLVLQKLTFFHWIRYYLISSLILAVIIPLFEIPILINPHSIALNILPAQTEEFNASQVLHGNSDSIFTGKDSSGLMTGILYLAAFCYFAVTSFKLMQFIRKLLNIKHLVSSNRIIKEEHYRIVIIRDILPAFSFLRYIFINRYLEKLDTERFKIIKKHELIHVNQLHSLDNILSEILLIVFWFNPVMHFFKKTIHEIHEFIVDEELTHSQENKKAYSNLLLNLAVQNVNISPFLGFSSIQINKRIKMLNKQRSNTMKKLSFVLIIPVVAIMLMSFSISEIHKDKGISGQQSSRIEKLIVGSIIWEGNTLYNDAELNEQLGLKPGDEYNHDIVARMTGKTPIIDMYMDNGYVFYNATHDESVYDKTVDITIHITEGNKGVIGIIEVTGNDKVPVQKILDKLTIHKGDLFNRTELINSLHAIGSIRKIDEDKIDVHVIPEQNIFTKDGYSIIDLEIMVSEN